eukprot:gene26921-4544_t
MPNDPHDFLKNNTRLGWDGLGAQSATPAGPGEHQRLENKRSSPTMIGSRLSLGTSGTLRDLGQRMRMGSLGDFKLDSSDLRSGDLQVEVAVVAVALLASFGTAEVATERRNLWGPVGPVGPGGPAGAPGADAHRRPPRSDLCVYPFRDLCVMYCKCISSSVDDGSAGSLYAAKCRALVVRSRSGSKFVGTQIGPLAAHDCAHIDNPCSTAACGPGSFVLESVSCTGSLNTDKLFFIGGYKAPSYYNIKAGYCMNQYNVSSTGPTTMHAICKPDCNPHPPAPPPTCKTCMDVIVNLPGSGVNSNYPPLNSDACSVLTEYLNSDGCGDAGPGDLVFTCAMAPMEMDYNGRASSVVTVCAEGYNATSWMSSVTPVCASKIAATLGYPDFCDVYVAINNTCMSPVQYGSNCQAAPRDMMQPTSKRFNHRQSGCSLRDMMQPSSNCFNHLQSACSLLDMMQPQSIPKSINY